MKEIIRYIDCDGVILDTESGLFDEYNKLKVQNPSLKKQNYLQQLNWREWIRQAKIINDAITIIKEHNADESVILTKVHSLSEGLIKIEYFRELGVKNNIILVPNSLSKSQVVQAKGNILIDDSIKNLDDWYKCNGISLFFKPLDKNNETAITGEKYPSITSLEAIFSKEVQEYCKKLSLKR